MLSRCNKKTLDTFDEKLGGRGYRRWRQQIETMAGSAGVDYLAALYAVCEIVMADVYTEEQMLLDDPRGIPYMAMPQIRQEALMAMIRSSLSVGGGVDAFDCGVQACRRLCGEWGSGLCSSTVDAR